MNNIILSPSDFAFGFDQCKKCYYDKIVNKVKLNGMFPSVFSKFDRCQKHYYHNKNSKFLNQDLDDGIINTEKSDFMMVSTHLLDNKNRPFILRGKLDAFIQHKDYLTVVDFKTTDMKIEKSKMYRNQLVSYALMLENPSKGMKLGPVKKLGLFCFDPISQLSHAVDNATVKMKTTYIDITRDDKAFYEYITKILDLIHGITKPESGEKCSTCKFMEQQNNLRKAS
tara:strand:+ start:55 stop:732 length:678 start_codon:yes stop_codon:yes gene_type:complete